MSWRKPTQLILKCLLVWTCLYLHISCFGQNFQRVTDSLLLVLEQSQGKEQQVDLLNEISYAYRRVSPEKVLEYAQQAAELAQQIQHKKGESIAHKNMGIAYYKMGVHQDTIVWYYQKAIDIAEEIDDYYTQAACNNNIALVYNTIADYHTAIQYYLKGIKIFDENFDEEMRLKGLMLGNVGTSYFRLKEYNKANEYLIRCIQLAERNKIKSLLSMYLDDLGRTYVELNRLEEAEAQFSRGFKIQKQLGDYQSSIQNLHHSIDLHIKQGHFKKAEQAALEAKSIAEERQFPLLKTKSLTYLSTIYLSKKDLPKAIEYGQNALANAKITKNKQSEKEILHILADIYALQNDFKKAYYAHTMTTAISDSIVNAAKTKITAELEASYQNREKERQIKFLNKEKAIQKNQIRLLGILMLTAILSLFIILYLLGKKRKQADIISEKNVELEKYIAYNLQLENFAYIASHDLKTPLRTIVSFTQLLKRKLKNKIDTTEREYLDFIIGSTKEMSYLIEDLLSYSRIQKQELHIEKIDLQTFVEKILGRIDTYIQDKQAIIHLDIAPQYIYSDMLKLQQLLQNLILNAIKFHRPDVLPVVEISCVDKGDAWAFEIRDNGIGIDEHYFDKIFLIFKRLNNKKDYEGSGIGLAICKKIVEQHQGKIYIESTLGQGSSFFFTISKNIIQEATKDSSNKQLLVNT